MLFLADGAVDVAVAPFSSATSVFVALLAFLFSAAAFVAARRKKNHNLLWVSAAFLVFAAKNLFSAYNVITHFVPHDDIELGLSLFDLAIMLILFIPLIFRRRS
jgi:predicted membrane-bound dolichyl-phosphate-mannose-protein mannosyltransferase